MFGPELTSSQRLARFLDRPLFPWKKLIVGFSLAQYLFEGFLSLRQYQVLKQTRPPKVLRNEVSQEVFDKSQVQRSLILSVRQTLTEIGLWTSQSEVWSCQRSLWSNPKHGIHLLRRSPQALGPDWIMAPTFCTRTIYRRDHTLDCLCPYLRSHTTNSIPADFDIPYICPGREIWIQ